MNHALSKEEVEQLVGEPIKMVTYPELKNYDSLEELFGNDNKVLIMYQSEHGPGFKYGHWCCITRNGDNVYFYDSYGGFIDDQLKHIPRAYRKRTGQIFKELSDLMYHSKYKKLHYNPYKHQGDDSFTCGRHAGLFMKLNVDPEIYHKIMTDLANKMSLNNDELSIILTENLI